MTDPRCALCQTRLAESEEISVCPECDARYHADCHRENGGCGTYGCSRVPSGVAPAEGLPQAVWGRESKPCPACGKEIRAVALRCRHCGSTFASVEPLSTAEHGARNRRQEDMQRLRRRATFVFVGGLIPFAFPLVLAAATPPLLKDRDLIRQSPPFVRFLGAAGLGLSALWVLVGCLVFAASGR